MKAPPDVARTLKGSVKAPRNVARTLKGSVKASFTIF